MRRLLWWVVAVVVLIPAILVLAAVGLVNREPVRTRLIAGLQRATGHAARLDGPLRVAWSHGPGIEAQGLVLLNPPGFSRPDFASARTVSAHMALVPLLTGRLAVSGVRLEGVEVTLERDATGRGNWLPPAPPPPTGPAQPARPHTPVQVQRLVIADARVAWWGGPPVLVPNLLVSPSGGLLQATLLVNGVPVAVEGRTGPMDRAPVLLDLALRTAGAAGSVQGEAGGDVQVTAQVPDLAALSPLAGTVLPDWRGVDVALGWGAAGSGPVKLTVAEADLAPGFRLTGLTATAAGMQAPVQVAGQGVWQALPFTLAASTAPAAVLFGPEPTPIQMQVQADGATLRLDGAFDRAGRSYAGTVAAQVPDLARTAALAGRAAPSLTGATLDMRVLPGSSGTVLLRGVRLGASQGDVAGDLALTPGPVPTLRGTLVSQRLDLDSLRWVEPPAAPPPAAAPGAAPPPAEPAAIPARPIPFGLLRRVGSDLMLSAGLVHWRGADWRGLETRLLIQEGRLMLGPLQMTSPGGALRGQVQADAGAQPPTAALGVQGIGLDAAGLAAMLGQAGAAAGQVDLDIDVRGAGADWRSWAGTMDGHAGVALVDGEVENRLLTDLFAPALRAAGLGLDAGGRSKVRCLAVRADAAEGVMTLHSLALDATRLRIEGDGTLNLREETMDLHLRPTVRLGGASVVVPVRLSGPFRSPKPAVDRGVIAPGRLGFSIGAAAAPDPCGPALLAARGGRAGALPQ